MRIMWKLATYVVFWSLTLPLHSARASEVVTDDAISQAAAEYGVSYDLLRAIATVESNRNPRAIGRLGEVGLFQLRPEFFGKEASTNALVNARAAARNIRDLKKQCASYGDAYFVCHNTGAFREEKLKYPTRFDYYRKVMAAKRANAAQRMVAGE